MKLYEIAEIVGGGTPSTKNNSYWNGQIPWITPKDLSSYNNKFISNGERFITEAGYDNSSAKMLPPNAILFTSRAPIGYIAIAKNRLCTNQGFKSLICDENKCDYMYMYYWLKNNVEVVKERANGSTFLEVSATAMKEIDIKLPSLLEQKKIARILSKIDEKIELNNQINDNLQELNKQLYKRWFIDFDFPNEDGEPYKTSAGKMIDSEFGEIPVGWEIKELGSVVLSVNGYSYRGSELVENSDIGMATIKNFDRTGGFKIDGYKSLIPAKVKEHHYIDIYDVVVAHTDLTQNADIIGNPILILDKSSFERIIISMDLVKVIPNDERLNNFILYDMLNSKEFKNHALGYVSGTTVLHLNKSAIKEYNVAIPQDTKLIKKYSDIVTKNYRRVSEIQQENQTLTKLRDTLLPKLMNGEINLENIEI